MRNDIGLQEHVFHSSFQDQACFVDGKCYVLKTHSVLFSKMAKKNNPITGVFEIRLPPKVSL